MTATVHKENEATAGVRESIPERDFSIDEFCRLKNWSRSRYFKARRQGRGPVETRYPGSNMVRITPQARRDFDAEMDNWQRSEDAQLEQQRREERARRLGKIAAKSEHHVSKTRIR